MKEFCLFMKINAKPNAIAEEIILIISFFLSEVIYFEFQRDPATNVEIVNINTIK